MKKGRQTTEFLVTMIVQFLGIGVTTGVITPEFQAAWVEGAATIGALLAQAISAVGYANSRAKTKNSEIFGDVERKRVAKGPMASPLILLAVILSMLAFSSNSHAIALSDTLELDADAELMYGVVDGNVERPVDNLKRFSLDVNSDFLLNLGIGVTYDNMVRVAGRFERLENFQDTYGASVELFLTRLWEKLPANAGVKYRYEIRKERITPDYNAVDFHFVGLTFRLK